MEQQSGSSVHHQFDRSMTTHAATPSNQSSPLLSLPQELKNRIYQYVLGGNFYHVYQDKLGLPLDMKTARAFFVYQSQHADPNPLPFLGVGSGTYVHVRAFGLLRTCRQMYKETKSFLYSANSYCFWDAAVLRRYVHHIRLKTGDMNLAIRSICINTRIDDGFDEDQWNKVLHSIHRMLPGLREVSIVINQTYTNRHMHGNFGYTNPVDEQNTFLPGLLGLKRLNLKKITLEFLNDGFNPEKAHHPSQDEREKWALEMKRAIMGSR